MNDIVILILFWLLIALANYWKKKKQAEAKQKKLKTVPVEPAAEEKSDIIKILRERFDIDLAGPPGTETVEPVPEEGSGEPFPGTQEPAREWEAPPVEEVEPYVREETSLPEREEKIVREEEPLKIGTALIEQKPVRKTIKKYLPRSKSELKKAVIFKEILDPPLSKRGKRLPYFLE
ncbi:MAG: hypothetical protein ACE5GL_02610 [Calditrichia bacterium]